jgi:UDP-glucose 4-epimerase
MNKVLITGVAGFIGSHIANRFISEGYEVVGVDDLSGGKEENIPAGIQFIKGDLAKIATISQLPDHCDLILHLAGQSSGEISFDDPVADLEKNAVSTLNLIHYGIRNKSSKLVYASSMSVYGSVPDLPIKESCHPIPLSCYGVGKLAAEGYLNVYKNQLPYVALRMFNVYGPGQDLNNMRQGMVSIFLAQALGSGKILVKGSTERFRDFIYIDDVVEAWFKAATNPSIRNLILNLGTGKRTSISYLLSEICNSVPGSEYFVEGSTPGDQNGIFPDVMQLKELLNINEFTELKLGIQLFVEWARKQGLN